jgi:anti-sigma B factor antagonist
MPDSDFPVTQQAGLQVVTTPDEIDIGNAGLLREALLTASARESAVVVVDMTGTEFCDSTGLNVLVRAQKRVQQEGREVLLAVRRPALRRILGVSGVGNIFRTYDTLADALLAGRGGQSPDRIAPGRTPADQV